MTIPRYAAPFFALFAISMAVGCVLAHEYVLGVIMLCPAVWIATKGAR